MTIGDLVDMAFGRITPERLADSVLADGGNNRGAALTQLMQLRDDAEAIIDKKRNNGEIGA